MAIVLEREIERAVNARLTPARRPAHPVVRFSPLFADPAPAARRRRRTLVWVSIAAHVLMLVTVTLMPREARTLVEPSLPVEVVFSAPMPAVPELVLPKPEPPKPAPRREPPQPKREDPPPVAAQPEPVVVKPAIASEPPPPVKVEPPRARPVVRTGLLDEPAEGLSIAASRSSRSSVVVSGFETAAAGPSRSARSGRVMEVAPFDAAPAAARGKRSSGGMVQETGFGAEAAAPAPKKQAAERPASPLDVEVEILSRPKPVYTEEARALHLEGDVVLSVVFEAAGTLRVLGVAQGLGHGLDEAAIDAAKKIRFNPARRDGGPVDYAAKLRVVFRLA